MSFHSAVHSRHYVKVEDDKYSVTYELTILIKQIRVEQQLSFLAVDLMASKVNLG